MVDKIVSLFHDQVDNIQIHSQMNKNMEDRESGLTVKEKREECEKCDNDEKLMKTGGGE